MEVSMNYYVVDAFAEEVFKGNPAGVCVIDKMPDRELMQNIAAENNLSETAFVVKREMAGEYDLKWFTPRAEIDLCGHATLGTAFVVSNFVDAGIDKMSFHTLSGILTVVRSGDLYELNFPSRVPEKINVLEEYASALGSAVKEAYLSRDLFLLMESEEAVVNLVPDFSKMQEFKEGLGVIVTAKGENSDFVSRCFYPKLGINEDPVTGSAHCNLTPFWAERLGKEEMIGKQLSERGGTVYCKLEGERVKLSGKAVLYLDGELRV
jgi:PhzF family phenazine biosynthesis protein